MGTRGCGSVAAYCIPIDKVFPHAMHVRLFGCVIKSVRHKFNNVSLCSFSSYDADETLENDPASSTISIVNLLSLSS